MTRYEFYQDLEDKAITNAIAAIKNVEFYRAIKNGLSMAEANEEVTREDKKNENN